MNKQLLYPSDDGPAVTDRNRASALSWETKYTLKGVYEMKLADVKSNLVLGSDEVTIRVWKDSQRDDGILYDLTYEYGFDASTDMIEDLSFCMEPIDCRDRDVVLGSEVVEIYTEYDRDHMGYDVKRIVIECEKA